MELRQLVKEVPYLLETRGDMSVEIAALCSNRRASSAGWSARQAT